MNFYKVGDEVMLRGNIRAIVEEHCGSALLVRDNETHRLLEASEADILGPIVPEWQAMLFEALYQVPAELRN